MNENQVYIQKGYMNGPSEIRMENKEGIHIITNAMEYLQKAIDSKGYKKTLNPGQKIYRITIND